MCRKQSAQEVEKEYIQLMGNELGIVMYVFRNEIAWLYTKWLQFKELYAHSPKRVALLNDTAGLFFQIVQDVLWDDILLHIARLADPLQTMGKKNFTIKRLSQLIADFEVAKRIKDLVDMVDTKAEPARDWRNRKLAHNDLNLALKKEANKLVEVDLKQTDEVLAALQELFNRIEIHFDLTPTSFDYTFTVQDAKDLVYHLDLAQRLQKQHVDRIRKGQVVAL